MAFGNGRRDPRTAPPAGARSLVLEQPLEAVKPVLARKRGAHPLTDLFPTHRCRTRGDDGTGRTLARGERQGKIGHAYTAVNEKALWHQ